MQLDAGRLRDLQIFTVAEREEIGRRAIDAICSHEHYFLDEGEVDPDLGTIECPKHGSTFDLETGKPRSLPAVTGVAVFDVKVENDDILIEV